MTSNTLIDFAKENFTPTSDQQNAIKALDRFLAGDEKVFILKGYAGSGKTTLTKLIADFITSTDRKPILMAPTGRAARIMLEKTNYPATTIHKGIYNMQLLDEIAIEKDDKVQYKFRFNLNQKTDNITNVYLIDEASMISDKYSEDDFFIFGSGIILKDLLKHIALGNLARKDKLIFIGDDAQLPPVTDNKSGALDADYLFKKYGIAANEYQLTGVIRQSIESGILENATRLRELIKLPGRQKFILNTNFSDIKEIKQTALIEAFNTINPALSIIDGIVLVSRNKTALDHNLLIRQHYFPDKHSVQAGETLLINQNNYNYEVELLNGMLVKVVAADEASETKSHMRSYDATGKECYVSHRFRWVTIEVPSDDGRIKNIRCMILDSFLSSPKRALDYEENIALYIDFKFRHSHLKVKTAEFTQAFRTDPYLNALKVKFGYAITVHKAQGGEWENVLVDMDFYQSYTSKAFLRWAYTAITRASKALTIFNLPSISLFRHLAYRDDRIVIGFEPSNKIEQLAEKLMLRLPLAYEQQIDTWFVNTLPFIIEKYQILLAQLQEAEIQITGRISRSFAEEYYFAQGNQQAIITYYYNGKNKFTRVLATPGKAQNTDLLERVITLTGIPIDFLIESKNNPIVEVAAEIIIADAEDAATNFFTEKHKHLQPLYASINELLKEKEITIQQIEHKEYLERYFISRGTQNAMIQFWYNGQNEFTTAAPHLPSCNSNELLEDIANMMNEIL